VELPGGGIGLAHLLCEAYGITPSALYPKFQTAKLVLSDILVEIAMTRQESYTEGKRFPKVQFTTLAEDAQRRDFTINALYQNICSGKMADPCQLGLADLSPGIIRSIRDPLVAFREDPLRMVRALRFAATLNFPVDLSSLEAIVQNRDLVGQLSRSRLTDEISRQKFRLDLAAMKRFAELARETGIEQIVTKKLKSRRLFE